MTRAICGLLMSTLLLAGCPAGRFHLPAVTFPSRATAPPEELDVCAIDEDEGVPSLGLAVGVQNIESSSAVSGTLDYLVDMDALRIGLFGVFAGGTTNMEFRLGARVGVVWRIARLSLELGAEVFGLARIRGVTGAGGGLGVRVGAEYRLSARASLVLGTSIAAVEYQSAEFGGQSDFIGAASLGLRVFFSIASGEGIRT